MNRKWTMRALSTVLAAQMLLVPTAQAVGAASAGGVSLKGTPPADVRHGVSAQALAYVPQSKRIRPLDRAEQAGKSLVYALSDQDLPPVDRLYAIMGYPAGIGGMTGFSYNTEGPELTANLEEYFRIVYDTSQDDEKELEIFDVRGGKYYLKPGLLPTKSELPRVPNYTFSEEWYIYNSAPGYIGQEFIRTSDQGLKNGDWSYNEQRSSEDYNPEKAIDDYDPYIYKVGIYSIALIGKWDKSTNATATELSLKGLSKENTGVELVCFADQDLWKRTKAELEEMPERTFAPETTEYYARVPAETTSVTFDLTAFEPDAALSVKWSYGNQEKSYDDSLQSEKYGLNEAGGTTRPKNTQADPARALWSLQDGITIALSPAQSHKGAAYRYNKIELTVTAPDGISTQTYTYYIQRLTDPVIHLNPGNSPIGMIARDTSDIWGDRGEKKVSAKAAFQKNCRFSIDNIDQNPYPASSINNSGAICTDEYDAKAWGANGEGENLDFREDAIFVYQNAGFTDPGIALYDAAGNLFDGAADGAKLERSIKLTLVDSLGPDAATDHPTGGIERYHADGSFGETKYEILAKPDGSDQVSLQGHNVKPGVYQIGYQYTDPYSGKTYSQDCAESFYQPESGSGYSRNLVVLPLRGDVDMDGAVTVADGYALQKLVEDADSILKNMDTGDITLMLYYYRVCDITGDGLANEDDAKLLRSGYGPSLKTSSSTVNGKYVSNYFYLPLGDQGEPERSSVEVVQDPDGSTPVLALEYLGVGTDPEQLNADAQVDFTPGADNVFWMGLKLSYAQAEELLRQGVTSFTATLAYDSGYLKPYTGAEAWNQYIVGVNSGWQDYSLQSSSGIGIEPVDHYSKALSGLNAQKGKLRELRFSVTLDEDGNALPLQNGCLLRVPFEMTVFPSGHTGQEASLVEMVFGMRDFTLTFADGSAVVWNNSDLGIGSPTGNAAQLLDYGGGAAVPVGKDSTPCYVFYVSAAENVSPVYGEECSLGIARNENGHVKSLVSQLAPSAFSGDLPDGLTYQKDSGTITGTPTRAGTYDFYITMGGETDLYRIVVEKSPLTLTVTDVAKYYGEDNTNTTERTFTYDTAEIRALDKNRGAANSGKAEDLPALLGATEATPEKERTSYTAPAIRLVTDVDMKKSVTGGTVPGDYFVLLEGAESTNYEFRYVRSDREPGAAADNELGVGKLTVKPRPIQVQRITKEPGGTLLENALSPILGGQKASYTQGEFTVSALKVTDGCYGGYPLTAGKPVYASDELELTYSLTFETDSDTLPLFQLTRPSKEYKASITGMSLEAGEGNANACYTLVKALPEQVGTTGMVYKRVLESITIDRQPTERDYVYGDKLSLEGLAITLKYQDSDATIQLASYTQKDYESYGLTISWVAAEGDEPGDDLAAIGQLLEVPAHHEKRLCISSQAVGDIPGIRRYTEPFTVAQRELLLTVGSQRRYYGEAEAEPVFRYDPEQLADQDQNPGLLGSMEELETLLDGYQAPTAAYRTQPIGGEAVTQDTGAGSYYVMISGAASDNYSFKYTQTAADGTVKKGDTAGYHTLEVRKRPILVTRIDSSAGTLFYETTRAYIADTTATLGGDAKGFTAWLPAAGKTYYPAGGAGGPVEITLPLNGGALYKDDLLTAHYRADFTTDHAEPPYFDLTDQEHKSVVTQVSGLYLEPDEHSENYELLYPSVESAMKGWTMDGDRRTTGVGSVAQRKIVSLKVTGTPVYMAYTYGEKLDLTGLKVDIYYEGSTIPERVSYTDTINGGVASNSFADKGLSVHWNSADGAAAGQGQYLTVAEHNGAVLVVTGQRHESHTEQSALVPGTIKMEQRVLTLTAVDQQRPYGEANGTYAFTFSADQLAPQDKAKVAGMTLGGSTQSADTPVTKAQAPALAKLNEDYEDAVPFVGPSFHPEADEGTSVREDAYPLKLTGGAMANYRLETAPGGITIVKRPVVVERVTLDPVYSIYHNTLQREFTTTCYVGAFTMEGTTNRYDQLALGTRAADGLTGMALREGDGLSVSMTVTYPASLSSVPAGSASVEQKVTISGLSLGVGGDNYTLVYKGTEGEPSDATATAEVSKRSINSIEINALPRKMSYTYGEALNLEGLRVKVTYDRLIPVESEPLVAYVDPTSVDGLYVNYWVGPDIPQEADWKNVPTTARPASSGDHLTIAKDDSGFAHDKMYLIISAQKTPAADSAFVTPRVSGMQIQVKPLELTYALEARDKVYDATTAAGGAITLTNVYKNSSGVGDQVYVVNGTEYTGTQAQDANYRFENGDEGLTFTFVDPNVHYSQSAHDSYSGLEKIPVEVTNIAIAGRDSSNYHINSQVLTDTQQLPHRDGAPKAFITRRAQDIPAVEGSLMVDEHTNVVTVKPSRPVSDFTLLADEHKAELHYEYALEYIDPEHPESTIVTPYQDSTYFGGEPVTVDVPEFEPDGTLPDRPEGTGGGQQTDPDDKAFGTRAALPRGTYLRAMVRLAATNNFEASAGQPSVPDLKAAVEEAQAQTPPAADDQERLVERTPGPLIKTYTYRMDLVSTEEQRGTDGEQYTVPTLEAVWFTDLSDYQTSRSLDTLVENQAPTRYYGYYWDQGLTKNLQFPLDLTREIWVDLPRKEGDQTITENTHVNADDTVRLFVPLRQTSTEVAVRSIKISPDSLTARVGDECVQLTVVFTPKYVTNKRIKWESSNPGVATVSDSGLVSFVGPGTAEITATSWNRKRDTILVRVESSRTVPFADTMFNVGYEGAFFDIGAGGKFYPERSMTRGELVVLMANFLQVPEGMREQGGIDFEDVPGEADYARAVRLLSRWGIVTGVGENTFAPDQPATRAEMSTILCRMLMLNTGTDPDAAHAFTDCTPGDTWAWPYIDALAQAGIVIGTGEGKFAPNGVLTRAQAATFLARVLATRVDIHAEHLIIPSDVAHSHWAYESILRALNAGQVEWIEPAFAAEAAGK